MISLLAMHIDNVKGRHQNTLDATIRFPIPDTSITLFLTDYGDRLNQQDLNVCLQDAGAYIVRQITLRGNTPMRSRRWNLNNVFLDVHPEPSMTLIITLEVISALEEIVLEHHWTFATQVLVMDARVGRLGMMTTGYWNTKANVASLKHTDTRRGDIEIH